MKMRPKPIEIVSVSHAQRAESIARQVRSYHERGKSFRVYHGSTNSTRVVRFDPAAMVNASSLTHVLSIDAKARTAIVEANVPMDQLVRATLEHGLIPPVVMEFPGITVGGGLQGGAGESSSFRYGCFNRTLNWYEMILANGKIIRVSPESSADLFWGSAGSYGSLGVVTKAEIQLIPASKYVEVQYTPVNSFAAAIDQLKEAVEGGWDYVDGIVFSRDSSVIITGRLTDEPQARTRRFSRARDEWFYLHVKKLARHGTPQTETIPIMDYLFRYDRGAFWMGDFGFKRLRTPFNRFSRWALNPLMNTRKMYQALQASALSQECIIQDLAIPARSAVDFIDYVDQEFGIYPLWLCPLLVDDKSALQANYLATDSIVNVGVWGKYDLRHGDFARANRLVEDKVHQLGGRKWLYAQTFYNQEAFWQIYNRENYDNLRQKYQATKLPTVYDKVSYTKAHPVSAKRGIWKALTSQDATIDE